MLAGHRIFVVALAASLILCACSDKAPPPAPTAATAPAADPPAATKSLEMYRELLQQKAYELAGPIGQEIVAKYPGSAAAQEVGQTLADASAKGSEIARKRRLDKLWIYQSGKESGGDQVTASIYSSEPASADRVRLVLRRHSAWGQSVYLFGSGKGFECGKPCTVSIRFDDAPPQRIAAHLPETGEPAIFITDDRAFIAKMGKAQKMSVEVRPKGKPAQTLVFEVGGYDATRLPAPPKGK